MEYSRKFVILSHCILNQLAVVKGEKRAAGPFPLAKILIEEGIGMIQLPCPEMRELGPNRPPMSYEDYDAIEGYRERCKTWLSPVLDQIEDYLQHGDQFLGLIGINQSPNCSISGKRGVWMEIIFEALETKGIKCPYIEVPTWYEESPARQAEDPEAMTSQELASSYQVFNQELRHFLKGETYEK